MPAVRQERWPLVARFFASGLLTAVNEPPSADTRQIGEPAVARRMTPSDPQLPPRGVLLSSVTVWTGPRQRTHAERLCEEPEEPAVWRPERKGCSVRPVERTSTEAFNRPHPEQALPLVSVATKASVPVWRDRAAVAAGRRAQGGDPRGLIGWVHLEARNPWRSRTYPRGATSPSRRRA